MMVRRARRKNTVAQAKNIMRRAVAEIVDPSPRNIDEIWVHFGDSCAYCGSALDRSGREGQIDHADQTGGNHLGNLVLACGTCNGDEKRDQSWREFLRTKASGTDLSAREARILEWSALHRRPAQVDSPEIQRVRGEIEDVIAAFEQKCFELKQLVGGSV